MVKWGFPSMVKGAGLKISFALFMVRAEDKKSGAKCFVGSNPTPHT
jgi:hypothetical protein